MPRALIIAPTLGVLRGPARFIRRLESFATRAFVTLIATSFAPGFGAIVAFTRWGCNTNSSEAILQ